MGSTATHSGLWVTITRAGSFPSRQQLGQKSKLHDRVMLKVPLPLQPTPLSVHWPLMVFPLALPLRVSMSPVGFVELIVIPNDPVTLPLKLPDKLKVPVSVPAFLKHGEADVKVKLLIVTLPSPFSTSDVPNVKTGLLEESVSVAFHVPLIFALEELEPQPTVIMPAISNRANANCFMKSFLGFSRAKRRYYWIPSCAAGGFGPQRSLLLVKTQTRAGSCCRVSD